MIFDLGKNYYNIKQIEIYNNEPFHAKGEFYFFIVYELTETQYIDNGIYQYIDAGITKVVIAFNAKGKFFEIKNPKSDKYCQSKLDPIKS